MLGGLAALVAGFEWVLGCWLIAGRALVAGLAASLALLALFSVAVVTLVVNDAPVGCGCGLPGLDAVAGPFHIIRNAILLLISGAALGMVLLRPSPASLVEPLAEPHEGVQA